MYRFLKFLLTGFFLFILITTLIFLNASFEISKKLGKPANYLVKTIYQASKENPYSSKEKINFIVLGLDERNDSLEVTETTDTIIFVSLNLKTFKINTVSIPRDLWFYSLNNKVNQIYPLSLEQPDKYSYIKDKFQELTGQNIDHVVVVNTNDLIDFVNLIGGVNLNLDIGFVDNQYPNPDYIADPSSGAPIYKTVEFDAGPIHLDESNITEFVRSRHGGETAAQGGTDIGRIHRQQLLIEAILNKIKSGEFIPNESQLISLYQFWQRIGENVGDINAIQILSAINDPSKLTFNQIDISIGTSAKDGLIYHPNTFINKQWVFIPNDPDYQLFKDFFKNSI